MNTRIGKIIKDSEFSQEYIAYRVVVSIFTIKNWINGLTYPDIDKAYKLKNVLGLRSVDDLITDKGNKNDIRHRTKIK